MLKGKLILIILLFPAYFLLSQDRGSEKDQIGELIKNQLISSELQKLEKIEKEEQNALNLMFKIDKRYEELQGTKQEAENQKDKKLREEQLKKSLKFENKLIRDHVKVFENISALNLKRYELYSADIKRIVELNAENESGKIDDLEKMASECMMKADFDKQKIAYTDNPNELFAAFDDAHKQEQLAILYQKKIYSILLKWDSFTASVIDEMIETYLSKKPEENHENKLTVDDIKDSVYIKTVLSNDTIKRVQISKTSILYKVQIAASKKPLSIEKLESIYSEKDMIQYEIDDKLYKYSVGYFFNYQDAKDFKIKTGVKDAFIIAYKNGKKVSIRELINHPSYLYRE